MALPVEVTDPGTAQVPLANVETQAFGLGLAAQVTATLEDNVVFHAAVPPSAASIGLPSFGIANVTDPGSQQVPLTNVETQAFGVGLPRNVNVG